MTQKSNAVDTITSTAKKNGEIPDFLLVGGQVSFVHFSRHV